MVAERPALEAIKATAETLCGLVEERGRWAAQRLVEACTYALHLERQHAALLASQAAAPRQPHPSDCECAPCWQRGNYAPGVSDG